MNMKFFKTDKKSSIVIYIFKTNYKSTLKNLAGLSE
ncbi:MAG: hypothetical protein ACI9UV_000830 [Algoriphagus sp.]|jgi:hypothetical protein